MNKKVLVIGLDCAAPKILFEDMKGELPNLGFLMEQGIYGSLTSCHPPITIPGWLVMTTGKDPGSLGLYGFRHRRGFSYDKGWIATSKAKKAKAVWDVAGDRGRPVCLVGVPPSYPPLPVNGSLISCFITPGVDREYTYPNQLQFEIENLVGEYLLDVQFRTEDRELLLDRLYEMTDKRFKVIEYLLKEKPWEFFMFVEIGVDRVHHAFWKYYDKEHPKYEPGSKFEGAIPDYYRFVDQKIGRVMELIDDDTVVLVVSDHGAKGMRGGFCINQWLIDKGYLVLKSKPDGVVNLDRAEIDWSKTKAWGWGGYYARIFFNVMGREPRGIIPPEDFEKEREALSEKLKKICDHTGRVMDNRVYKPEELYSECKGDPPDLMVYFDDLYWRSIGTIGHNSLYVFENDTGPDDAVHDYDGIFILYDPKKKYSLKVEGANILDVAPTILHLMNLPRPDGMKGRVLLPDFVPQENGLRFLTAQKSCCAEKIYEVNNLCKCKIGEREERVLDNRGSAVKNGRHRNLNVNSHPGRVIWLTGLSAAGKSTLARALAEKLRAKGHRVEVLDGDEVRQALSPDLGFSKEDRELHNQRVIYLSKLLSRNGVTVIVPLISPYRHIREKAREQLDNFIEVWVKCSLTECIRRDPKGLYKKALDGEIKDLTGLQDPYEEPVCPEVIVDTEKQSVEECVEEIIKNIEH